MIGTEQERAALMAAVRKCCQDNCPKCGGSTFRAEDSFAAIRAMLAPPDDAVVRERIATAIADYHNDQQDQSDLWYFCSVEDAYGLAESVIAVLRGEATR